MTDNVKARGSNSRLVYTKKTAAGTIATSGTLYEMPFAAEGFDNNQNKPYDTDITNDGQHSSTVAEVFTCNGSINGQTANEQLDDFIPALCGRSDWTTNTFTLNGDITVSDGVGTFTASDTPDLSDLVPNAPATIAGTASNDDTWFILSVNTGTYTFTFSAFKQDQAAPVAEAGLSSDTLTQEIVHFGGDVKTFFDFCKEYGVYGSENAFSIFQDTEVNSLSLAKTVGGGMTHDLQFMHRGLNFDNTTGETNDSGLLAAYDYTNAPELTATDDQVSCVGGTGDFAVGDYFWFAGDAVKRSVVSIGATAQEFKFDPAIETGTTITAGTNIYCGAVATLKGDTQKIENNLAYLRANGQAACFSNVTLTVSRNMTADTCVGNPFPDSNEPADSTCELSVTGKVDERDIDAMKKIRAGITFAHSSVGVDRDGNVLGYVVHKADGSPAEAAINNQGILEHPITFQALKDDTFNTYVTFFKA